MATTTNHTLCRLHASQSRLSFVKAKDFRLYHRIVRNSGSTVRSIELMSSHSILRMKRILFVSSISRSTTVIDGLWRQTKWSFRFSHSFCATPKLLSTINFKSNAIIFRFDCRSIDSKMTKWKLKFANKWLHSLSVAFCVTQTTCKSISMQNISRWSKRERENKSQRFHLMILLLCTCTNSRSLLELIEFAVNKTDASNKTKKYRKIACR